MVAEKLNRQMLAEEVKATFKDAAKKLAGYGKRDFMANLVSFSLQENKTRSDFTQSS